MIWGQIKIAMRSLQLTSKPIEILWHSSQNCKTVSKTNEQAQTILRYQSPG